MTISSFQQFALSRAEIKNIVGGYYEAGKKCTGTCTVRNEDNVTSTVGCVSTKVNGTKSCGCGNVTSTTVKSGCSWSE